MLHTRYRPTNEIKALDTGTSTVVAIIAIAQVARLLYSFAFIVFFYYNFVRYRRRRRLCLAPNRIGAATVGIYRLKFHKENEPGNLLGIVILCV